jgi:alpha/beta superfamily hydrolase
MTDRSVRSAMNGTAPGSDADSEAVALPGDRDARGTLDRADDDRVDDGGTADDATDRNDTAEGDATAVVVACPPHPQHGGDREDSRLIAVAEALNVQGIDCLRFDYGEWDEGRSERLDVLSALRWATGRYDAAGLFGHSFGATTALCAAGRADEGALEAPTAVSVLAPDRGEPDSDHDAVAALNAIACPVQICHGERDTTVDWEPVVERAREHDLAVESIPADHFFVGQSSDVTSRVVSFLAPALR